MIPGFVEFNTKDGTSARIAIDAQIILAVTEYKGGDSVPPYCHIETTNNAYNVYGTYDQILNKIEQSLESLCINDDDIFGGMIDE